MKSYLNEKQAELIDTIKLLIYKEDKNIFNLIDFYDNQIYLNPLLFVYFNEKANVPLPKELLSEILQSYFLIKPQFVFQQPSKNEITYIPNIGYFKDEILPFEIISKIDNTQIEIITYRIPLLDVIFLKASNNKISINEFIINNDLVIKNLSFLTNALQYIKKSSTKQFELIEQCCKQIVLFKTNPKNTNSFATINAHGIAFLNVYQEDYDEVFFVDDIAHQTGHIILTTLLSGKKSIFLIDYNQNIEKFIEKKDYRDIYILFHALYTYYATFICLKNCVNENLFNKNRQKDEAIARIGFYLIKCKMDLLFFEKIINYHNEIENVFNKKGIELYFEIKNKYIEIKNIFANIVDSYNYENQPYNFDYNKFKYLNN